MKLSMRPVRALLAITLSFQLAAPVALAEPASPAKPDKAKQEKAEKKSEKKAEKKEKKSDKKAKKDDEKPAAEEETPPAPPPIPSLGDSLTGSAKDEYEAGKVLFLDGDYAGAKLKFDRVYELSNDARVLWNVAAAEKSLRHYSKTVSALKRYLDEGGDKLTEQDRSDATQLIQAMSAFIASVDIGVDQADAEIKVDDEVVGRSPLPGPVTLDQGDRKLRVTKDGFKPYEAVKKISGGEAAKFDVKLVAIVHQGRLRVLARPGDVITVDGRVVGKGTYDATVESGPHALSVTAKGKRPHETDVIVQDDQTTTQRIVLEDEKREEPKGFMAGPWPWVIGGAVIFAGAGVGAYFLFRPEDQAAPRPTGGTLNPGTVNLPLRF